jgi:Uma2 family endonuclease
MPSGQREPRDRRLWEWRSRFRGTVAHLDRLPDGGNRYEVLAGTLLVTPSPGSAHQGVAARLCRSSRVYDREFTRDAYLALGVREVWLVNVRDRSIEVCLFSGAGRVVRDAVTWTAPDGDVSVHVELAELFSGIV